MFLDFFIFQEYSNDFLGSKEIKEFRKIPKPWQKYSLASSRLPKIKNFSVLVKKH